MAANLQPLFALTPRFTQAELTAAVTTKVRDVAGLVTLVTGTTYGTKITEIGYKFEGNSAAGQFVIWVSDTGGTNVMPIAEIPIAAVTSSTTVASASGYITFADFQIASGQIVKVSMTTISGAVPCAVYAKVGDF